jgi:hypothetical protein
VGAYGGRPVWKHIKTGALGVVHLWYTGHVPRVVLLARSHSLSPWDLFAKVLVIRARQLKRRVARSLRLDSSRVRLTPQAAAAVLKFRRSKKQQKMAPPTGAIREVAKVIVGSHTVLRIHGAFPRTKCFVCVDVEMLAIRWTQRHSVSLAAIQMVQRESKPMRRGASGVRRMTSTRQYLIKSSSRETVQQYLIKSSSRETVQQSSARAMAVDRISSLFRNSHSGPQPPRSERSELSSVTITFSDRGGVTRVLDMCMLSQRCVEWMAGIESLRQMLPQSPSPALWRWSMACMAATSKRGGTGFLRVRELRALLRCANASPTLSTEAIEEAFRSVVVTEQQLGLPSWLCSQSNFILDLSINPAAGNEAWYKLVNGRLITGMLHRLSMASQVVAECWNHYAGDGKMGETEFLDFVRTEQLPSDQVFERQFSRVRSEIELENDSMQPSSATDVQLAVARREFETLKGSAQTGLSLLQFAEHLLRPQNNAAAPARDQSDFTEALGEPITHYWISSTHNSYIVGDQLTGDSSADACNRSGGSNPRPANLREAVVLTFVPHCGQIDDSCCRTTDI